MGKPRMEQLHSANMQLWNFKGAITNNSWNPSNVLSSDAWHVTADVTINSVSLRPGDLVIALVDNPDPLSSTTVTSGAWKIVRHLKDDEITWLQSQLYDPPSATLLGGTTLEKHYSALQYAASLSWTVSTGTNPTLITQELQKKEGGGSWTKVTDVTGASGTETVNVAINTDTQFRIYISSKSEESIYSSIQTVSFQYKTGYRVDVANPTINSAWLHAGTMGFDSDEYRQFTVDAGANQHIFYYVPKSYVADPYIRPPYFWVGGIEGGFNVHTSSASYTFSDGTTSEDYVVYRSTNANLGNTIVNVQST